MLALNLRQMWLSYKQHRLSWGKRVIFLFLKEVFLNYVVQVQTERIYMNLLTPPYWDGCRGRGWRPPADQSALAACAAPLIQRRSPCQCACRQVPQAGWRRCPPGTAGPPEQETGRCAVHAALQHRPSGQNYRTVQCLEIMFFRKSTSFLDPDPSKIQFSSVSKFNYLHFFHNF